MRGSLLACLLAMFAACLGADVVAAQNNYGAIAYSPSTHAIGWSYDYGSRAAAEDAALVNCRKQANDCVTHWFYNACAALAVGSAGYGMGSRPSHCREQCNPLLSALDVGLRNQAVGPYDPVGDARRDKT